jgi:hypothetical protein
MSNNDDWLRRLREQQEMFRRLAEGPLQYLRENESAIARMQEMVNGIDRSALQRAAQSFDVTRNMPDLVRVSQLTSEAFRTFTVPESIREMQRFADQHRQMVADAERAMLPPRSVVDQVQSMAAYIGATRLAAETLQHDRIGQLILAAQRDRDMLARVSDTLALRHADLLASLNAADGRLASVPTFVSEVPTVDLFVHTEAVRIVTPHDVREPGQETRIVSLRLQIVDPTTAYLEVTLPELNPPFLEQYHGAKAIAAERGPDWWTQGAASLRKLMKGVLHTAARDEDVLPWARENKKELDQHGHPTRATKIDWLCGFISNEAYRAFVQTELHSALALIGLFDSAVHVDQFPEFEAQYDYAVLRVEVAIYHILTIWKARRNAH